MFGDTAELELGHGLLLRSVIHRWASPSVVIRWIWVDGGRRAGWTGGERWPG